MKNIYTMPLCKIILCTININIAIMECPEFARHWDENTFSCLLIIINKHTRFISCFFCKNSLRGDNTTFQTRGGIYAYSPLSKEFCMCTHVCEPVCVIYFFICAWHFMTFMSYWLLALCGICMRFCSYHTFDWCVGLVIKTSCCLHAKGVVFILYGLIEDSVKDGIALSN